MTDDAKNKRVAEWLGISWHEESEYDKGDDFNDPQFWCSCCACYGFHKDLLEHIKSSHNTDFSTDPLALLRLMREREDWFEFYQYLNQPAQPDWVDLILVPGALLKAVDEFRGRREGK